MSLQQYAAVLQIKPRFSFQLAALVLISHAGAGLLLVFVPLPAWALVMLVGAIVYSLVHTLNFHVLRSAQNAVVSLMLESSGEWSLFTRSGDRLSPELLATTYIHPLMTILNFREGDKKRSLVLFPDAVDRNTFRRLRVRLLIENMS